MKCVVVGGGVAGVTCVEELTQHKEASDITLISSSTTIKGIANYVKVTDVLEEFDVEEQNLLELPTKFSNVTVIHGSVVGVDHERRQIHVSTGDIVSYDKLCICTGAVPNVVISHPRVIGLRDTATIEEMAGLVKGARRVAVVGNGGIALGLVHELVDVEIVWAIRHEYVGNTFFDASASAFFLDSRRFSIVSSDPSATQQQIVLPSGDDIVNYHDDKPIAAALAAAGEKEEIAEFVPTYGVLPKRQRKRHNAKSDTQDTASLSGIPSKRARLDEGAGVTAGVEKEVAASLGPTWVTLLRSLIPKDSSSTDQKAVLVETRCELQAVGSPGSQWQPCQPGETGAEAVLCEESEEWPCYIRLTNGHTYGCDFVVSATGVKPNTPFISDAFQRHVDGGLVVNRSMQTTGSPHIYAAGDAAAVLWPLSSFPAGEAHVWFPMRLWSQARIQGAYAARCMLGAIDPLEEEGGGLHFQLFAHMTHFMGYKVVLLGAYNGQGLGSEYAAAVAKHVVRSNVDDAHITTEEQGETIPSSAGSRIQLQYRVTPGVEYIKVVICDGKVVGGILIGDTDLEETLENLILNGTNITDAAGGEILDLLRPDVDIEDYFD